MGQFNVGSWFEIPVRDMSRAVTFYERVLGVSLSPREMGNSKMAFFPRSTGEGCGGSLLAEDGAEPSLTGSIVYLEVADINATLTKVNAAGGKTLVPRLELGPMGAVAQFSDSEGNRVGLHSEAQ